jgi:protein gp37
MGTKTEISWTHHTFNPWWGCTRVSPGCEHCYAETFAKRTGLGWGVQAPRRFFTDKHWNEPRKWNAAAEKAGERRRVFCASMADVFEDRAELNPWRLRLWDLIAVTPWLDWQLLTKRPENVADMVPWSGFMGRTWPANVWLGTTVEDQKRADERIPALLEIPARVRFLSCEPLLERVDLWEARYRLPGGALGSAFAWGTGIDWVIIGGESGGKARPFDIVWAQDLIQQCERGGAAVFCKQLGARPNVGGTLIKLADLKGGDWDEWSSDLRVRQFPEPRP